MITFDEAVSLLAEAGRPLGCETLALERAHGRVLAAPVVAAVNAPPADVTAMDGYAVRDIDLGGAALRLVGESFPGAGFSGTVGAGECVRIFTGAPVPAGADRVIVQEIVRRDGDLVLVEGAYSDARHIRRLGSDFAAGDILLDAGRPLGPRALVAVAGADIAEVEVWRQPAITVLGTGDELVPPGEARHRPGSIAESVSFGVAAMAEQWGAHVHARERLPDEPDVIERAAAAALDRSDLLIVTGGASVGEKDYAKSVLARLGLELIFSKVAIKPGKPVWLGRAQGKLVLGLPGNPTSALVTARLIMAPLLAAMSGRNAEEALEWRSGLAGEPLKPNGDRETFMRGVWSQGAVIPLANQDSGAQRALSDARLLIRRRIDAPAAEAGATVDIIDF